MVVHKPFVITFAGPPGTSKTPIAFYLSHTFRLPIIQMDAIRLEVREDLLIDDSNNPSVREEFRKRAISRYQALLQKGVCFVDDSSADRSWKQHADDQYYQLMQFNYDHLIISMDLSKHFVAALHEANKSVSAAQLSHFFEDHQRFLQAYGADVGVHITDDNFLRRMDICEAAVREFLAGRA